MWLYFQTASFPVFQLCQQLSSVIYHSESQTLFSHLNVDLHTSFWTQTTETDHKIIQLSLFLVFAIKILFNVIFLTFLCHKLYLIGPRTELILPVLRKLAEMPKRFHRYLSNWEKENLPFFFLH